MRCKCGRPIAISATLVVLDLTLYHHTDVDEVGSAFCEDRTMAQPASEDGPNEPA